MSKQQPILEPTTKRIVGWIEKKRPGCYLAITMKNDMAYFSSTKLAINWLQKESQHA